MSHCPYCDEWRYDPTGVPIVAKPIGQWLPIIWDGQRLRRSLMNDAPDGHRMAVGRHICEAHPMEPEVLLLGPVRIEFFFTRPAA